jgi:hypothetical protein
MRGMREGLTRHATGMLYVAIGRGRAKRPSTLFGKRDRHTESGQRVEDPSRGGWPPLQRLISQALAEDQTNRRTDPGRMIAYAKP